VTVVNNYGAGGFNMSITVMVDFGGFIMSITVSVDGFDMSITVLVDFGGFIMSITVSVDGFDMSITVNTLNFPFSFIIVQSNDWSHNNHSLFSFICDTHSRVLHVWLSMISTNNNSRVHKWAWLFARMYHNYRFFNLRGIIRMLNLNVRVNFYLFLRNSCGLNCNVW
jgi:hypothetical protein